MVYNIDGAQHTVYKQPTTTTKTTTTAPKPYVPPPTIKPIDTVAANRTLAAQQAAQRAAAAARQMAAYQERMRLLRVAQARAQAEAKRRAAEFERRRQMAAARQAELLKGEARRRAMESELRRRREAVRGEMRRKAWADLMARRRAVSLSQMDFRDQRRAEGFIRQDQARTAGRAMARDRQVVQSPDSRVRAMRETVTRGDLDRDRVLRAARQSGDYTGVLRRVLDQTARSGGRYYDEKLYDAAHREMNKLVVDADNFVPMYEKLDSLVNSGKVDEAERMWNDPDFQEMMRRYFAVYGDGRQSGSLEGFVNLNNQIADARDRYMERVILGQHFGQSNLLTDEELEKRKEEVGQAIRRRARTGVTTLDGEERSRGQMSLRSYIGEIEQARTRQVFNAMQRQQRNRDIMEFEGLSVVERGNQAYLQDDNYKAGFERAWQFWELGNLSEGEIRGYLEQINTGRFDEEADARDALIRAAEAGLEEYLRQNPQIIGAVGGTRQRSVNDVLRQSRARGEFVEHHMRQITRLLGSERGVFEQIGRIPVAGGLLQAMQIGASAVTIGAYDMLFPGIQAIYNANPLLPDTESIDNRSDERKQAFQTLLQQLGEVGYSEDIVASLRAIGQQGAVGVTGDAVTDFLIQAVSDPLVASPGARLLRGAGLAIGEVGGVRSALNIAARGGKPLRELTGRTTRFALPQRLGGIRQADSLRIEVLQKLAKSRKLSYAEVRDLSDDDLYTLAKGVLDEVSAKHLAGKSEGLAKLLGGSDVNSQQILSFVQANARDFFRASGRTYEGALNMGERIAEARRLHTEAKAAMEAIEHADARLAERLATAKPLDQVRAARARETGIAAPQRPLDPSLPSAVQAKIRRLEASYHKAVSEFSREAERTMRAADELAKREITDYNQRRALHAQLERGLAEMRKYDDVRLLDGSGEVSPGIITQRRRALAEYRTKWGAGSGAPSFPDVDLARIRGDLSYIRTKLAQANQRLAAATTDSQKAYWRRAVGRLEAARAGLHLEREFVGGPVRAAQKAARRNATRILGRFNRSRIAVWTPNVRAVRTSLLRDVSARLYGRTIMEVPVLDEAVSAAMRLGMRKALGTKLVVTGPLDDLIAEVGRDLTVGEAYQMTRDLVRSYNGNAVWRDAHNAVRRQMARILGGDEALNSLDQWILYGHQDRLPGVGGRVLTMKVFRQLDREMAEAIRKATGFQRKGKTRAARTAAEAADDEPSAFVLFDDKPKTLAAKMEVLSRYGLTMRQYDELRSVLGDINQRQISNTEMRRKAQVTARETGRSEREVFEELRERDAMRSAEGDFAEFASREENFGLPDDILVRRWEEEHALGQMVPVKRELTPYQASALEVVWRGETGNIPFSDEAFRRRVLGGFDELPEGARRPRAEEVAGVDVAGTPVYIVLEDHPKLAGTTRSGKSIGAIVHRRFSVLVDNEGVWIKEGTHPQVIHHELFHAWVSYGDNRFLYEEMSASLRNMPRNVVEHLFEKTFKYGKVADYDEYEDVFEELLADMFMVWRSDRAKWDAIVVRATGTTSEMPLREIASAFERFKPAEPSHFGFTNWHPPFGNRAAMREWLVNNGFWAPKTAEEIVEGARVWSVDQEREFWEANFGDTPDWTKEEIMRPLLDDPESLQKALQGWGFFENTFEATISGVEVQARDVHGAIAFGHAGLKRGRTLDELRDWSIRRYGKWVTDDGNSLTTLPALMTPDEYATFLAKHTISEAGLKMLGLKMGSGLVTPGQLDALSKAVQSAVKRHFDELSRKLGDNIEVLLPEESYKFALGVTDELMASRAWQPFFQRGSLLQRALRIAGLQRVLVTFTTAFPVMNILETFGLKAVLTSVLRNRGRWIYAVGAQEQEWIPTLASVAGDSPMTWGLSAAPAYMVVGDKRLPFNMRAMKVPSVVTEAPLVLSQKFENMHRLAFAQQVGGRTIRDLMATGMDEKTAILFGRLEAHRQLSTFFSILEDASDFEKALNQIIPFFSYNYKNSLVAVRAIWEQPWMVNVANNLGELLEEHARSLWEAHFGEIPFPEDDKMARHFWFETPWGTIYHFDLSMFSDWTRQMVKVVNADTVPEALGLFLRVPHPLQAGIWATVTGGVTPWGNPGGWRELSPWADLFTWLAGSDYEDPRRQRDLMQMVSQMLFFKAFGRLDPIKAKVQQFFAFMELDTDKAWEYYRENPDLQSFFALNGTRMRVGEYQRKLSWHATASEEDIAEYDRLYAEYNHLRDSLDARLDEFYLEPWSDEYKAWKKQRYAILQKFLHDNPLLSEVWGFWYTRDEFSREFDEFKTDMLVEGFFDIPRPKASAFETDLEFQKAMLAYYENRRLYLEANPDVADRLYSGRNAVERAWFAHELQWSDIAERQAHLKIRIAEEEAKLSGNYEEDKARRGDISFLYELSDLNYKMLDRESFGAFYDLLDTDLRTAGPVRRMALNGAVAKWAGRLKHIVAFPGRADYFYANATPEERLEIEADEKYYDALGSMMDEMKGNDDFSQFWPELRKRGLLDRYLKDNPTRRVDYEYSTAISAVFEKGGPLKFWDNLMANPTLLGEYLRRNPEKYATYQRVLVGKRYYNAMQELWGVIGDDYGRFYDELNKRPWLRDEYFRRNPEKAGRGGGMTAYGVAISDIFSKSTDGIDFYRRLEANPELMAEYFRRHPDKGAAYESGKEYFNHIKAWVEALKRQDFVTADRLWSEMPGWVHDRYFVNNPDSAMQRREPVQDGSYAAAIGTWVEFLKAKEYERADEYFKALPDWVKERYYQRHPDQRAKHDFDSEALANTSRYFLAAEGDKAKFLTPEMARWLAEHGDDEAAMRGLIFAIYRAIPTREPWLKRTFRERYPELFGKDAQGQRRTRRVLEQLAKYPEMVPFYEKALKIQTDLYINQLRLNKKAPKPLTMERRSRFIKRRKRRAARLHSRWRRFMSTR